MVRIKQSEHGRWLAGDDSMVIPDSQVAAGSDAWCSFREKILSYYKTHRRQFDWRQEISAYRVFVSEIMLQQTQTVRVIPKYREFIGRFPDFQTLAAAPFSEVLRYWKGLGYNRRARYLQESAAAVLDLYDGSLPEDPELLVRLPGIGPATAASMIVFTHNIPLVFVETNIRTVFIYFFFSRQQNVRDAEIMSLVSRTLDRDDPRQWYYALMDYGVMLKKTIGNLSRKSSGYKKQSRFQGSDRQLRGQILQLLLDHETVTEKELEEYLLQSPDRLDRIITALCAENIISKNGKRLFLA